MPKRFKFKKVYSGEPGRCLHCGKFNTYFALYDSKNGSEQPLCVPCAVLISKGRASGLSKYVKGNKLRQLALKISEKPLIKNEENTFIGEVSELPEASKEAKKI